MNNKNTSKGSVNMEKLKEIFGKKYVNDRDNGVKKAMIKNNLS